MTEDREPGGARTKAPAGRPRRSPAGSKQPYYRAWFATLAGFADHGVKTLKRGELAVFLLLLRDTRPDGTARAGLTDLATRGGMSKRSAIRAVQTLTERGVVRVVRPGVRGKATLYTVFPVEVFRRLNPIAARWLDEAEKG
ncbi:helix-turn-helix domain-containing protein [Paludisphaera soli]|uniref:helix-turn-helix domain-containing protein n=1 Tax=Paludisphaera soli TaxID=2712865 RepID=UPI0013EA1A27|nr:helix-turn-helix domain-containing protein [Paludisphaera soli]